MCIRSQSSNGRLSGVCGSSAIFARSGSAATKKRRGLEAVRRRVGSPRAISSARLSTLDRIRIRITPSLRSPSRASRARARRSLGSSRRGCAPLGSVAPSVVLPRSGVHSLATSLAAEHRREGPEEWDPREWALPGTRANARTGTGTGRRTPGRSGKAAAPTDRRRAGSTSRRDARKRRTRTRRRDPGGGSSFVSVRVRSSSSGSLRVGTARSWGRVRDGRRGCAREGPRGVRARAPG